MSLSNISNTPVSNPVLQHLDFLAAESASHAAAAVLLVNVMTITNGALFGALTHLTSEGLYQIVTTIAPSVRRNATLSPALVLTSHIIGMITAFFAMASVGYVLTVKNVLILTVAAVVMGSILGTNKGSLFGISQIMRERAQELGARA